jgi:3-deoxy-D-manno-octulosonic-acid transferase
MRLLVFWLYNLIIVPLLFVSSRAAGLFNAKIRTGLRGRQRQFSWLEEKIKVLNPGSHRLWIHISSMGEFEQAKPIIREVRKRYSGIHIIVSFFSPSGFANAQAFHAADIVCYLPFDSYWGCKKFLKIINPAIVVIVRHDIWPNIIWQLKVRAIPVLLVDASISQEKERIYSLFRAVWRTLFAPLSQILTVSNEHVPKLSKIYPFPAKIISCGDTRYDQVYYRCTESDKIRFLIEGDYFQKAHTITAGSTWPSDEKVILPVIVDYLKAHAELRLILAPHEIVPVHIDDLIRNFDRFGLEAMTLSRILNSDFRFFRIFVVDRIGLLANLYRFGRLAFVGGGFGPGVHNVLEPAAHGCAVLFGPRFLNSIEAPELVRRGGAVPIGDKKDLQAILHDFVNDPQKIERIGCTAKRFVEENMGASQRIVDVLATYLGK